MIAGRDVWRILCQQSHVSFTPLQRTKHSNLSAFHPSNDTTLLIAQNQFVIVIGHTPPIRLVGLVPPMTEPFGIAGTICTPAVPVEAPAGEYVIETEPPDTGKILKLLLLDDTVPPIMVPPAELTQLKFVKRLAQFTAEIPTLVPSGTVLPAESLMPEKVMVTVPPAEIDTELGPDAVAEVMPRRLIVPTA